MTGTPDNIGGSEVHIFLRFRFGRVLRERYAWVFTENFEYPYRI